MFLSGSRKVFGLDIGFETLKLCEVKKSRNSVELIGISEVPLTERILENDRIKDKAKTASIIKEARRKAKPKNISATGIVTALPENFVFSKTIQIPKMSDRELVSAVPNEAAQYLPVPLEEVYVDYQILITHPEEAAMDVLVAAAPKKLVDDYVDMARMAGLELMGLETKPVAVGRAIISEAEKAGVLIVHIGTELTRISIWDRGQIRLATTATFGKNQIIKSLPPADVKKSDITKIKMDDTKKTLIDDALEPIIEESLEAIRYHHNRSYKPEKISKIMLCGSGALLKGIDKMLEEKTKIKTEIAKPKLKTSKDIPPQFLTSFGLSLRRL